MARRAAEYHGGSSCSGSGNRPPALGSTENTALQPASISPERTDGPTWTEQLAALDEVGWRFSFAYQPIVDARSREVISYEALVRGPHGELSAEVFARVRKSNLRRFDHLCHLRAIEIAARLGISTQLNLNLFTRANHITQAGIRLTLHAAMDMGLPSERLVFEICEAARLIDYARLTELFRSHEQFGFQTAIDDFGTGYSGLKFLVEYQPGYIKLDRNLIAGIDEDRVRQSIVRGLLQVCRSLSIDLMAEGVETADEYRWLFMEGVYLFQGFYFGRPAFEALPEVPAALFSI